MGLSPRDSNPGDTGEPLLDPTKPAGRTLALVPQIVDAVSCRYRGRGIGDGRGIAAALAFGGSGVHLARPF
ncbi:MAG: hypothetical protein CM1200mP20_11160 [Pseudomonadota bacterium]|nr:MAG: hypothetical protein CM1200mP20_11160 [Pseudomonadota bacterium]